VFTVIRTSPGSVAFLVPLLLAPNSSLAQTVQVPPTTPIIAQDTVSARSQWSVPFARGVEIEQDLESDSANFALRCQAARRFLEAASIHGGPELVDSLTARAQRHAEIAVSIRPPAIDGHYLVAAAAGKRAKVVRGRPQVDLAARAWREAAWILERSPDHAGAHHVLGRVSQGVVQVNSVTRFLARILIGGEVLGRASWEQALFHLQRAVELDPGNAMYLLDLAILYRDMERYDEMRRVLQRASVARGSGQPLVDEAFREFAREMLQEEDVGAGSA
jgi:tetratricopeptide (TPR) repeat protein